MSQARLWSLLVFNLPILALAQLPAHQGFYLGLAGGYGNADYSSISYLNNIQFGSIDESGLAPSIQAGYEFNRWAALELSVIYLHRIYFSSPNIDPAYVTQRTKNNVVYLAFKPRWFFWQNYFAFAKLGIGYVVNNNIIVNNEYAINGDEHFRPVYGLGLGWRPGVHWQLELAWTQTPANNSEQLASTNFEGFGIQYLF